MHKTYFEIIFDTETKTFYKDEEGFDPSKFGVSIASVYSRTLDENFKEVSGKMHSYWESDFPELFKLFEKADRIIGFNSIGFDVPALSPYFGSHWPKLKHFDILEKIRSSIGKRVSLNSIAKATLNSTKSDHGENAILYWEKGDPASLAKLKTYCEMDVAITRDVYDYAFKNGLLKYIDYWNETHDVKLDFSYPQPTPEIQSTLF